MAVLHRRLYSVISFVRGSRGGARAGLLGGARATLATPLDMTEFFRKLHVWAHSSRRGFSTLELLVESGRHINATLILIAIHRLGLKKPSPIFSTFLFKLLEILLSQEGSHFSHNP